MKQKIENSLNKISDVVKGRELHPESKSNAQEEKENKEDEAKNLNQRIEDLVKEMEKNTRTVARIFSLRSSFIRGLFQGLGIIIGSTILAGALYSMSVNLFGEDVLKGYVLENIIEKSRE